MPPVTSKEMVMVPARVQVVAHYPLDPSALLVKNVINRQMLTRMLTIRIPTFRGMETPRTSKSISLHKSTRTLHDKKTLSGVTLEDIIQCGVALPLGADPPRGIGVYAGDAECYTVFAPLLDPMIAEYHGTQQSESSMRLALRRHSTNLDPEMVLSQRPDPTGEYILYTRMRVARSIEGFVFSPSISRSDRRKLQSLVQDCVEDWKNDNGKYVPVYHMSKAMYKGMCRAEKQSVSLLREEICQKNAELVHREQKIKQLEAFSNYIEKQIIREGKKKNLHKAALDVM